MKTYTYNGIEFRLIGDGMVEIFSDRPSIARLDELIKLFSSLEEQNEEVIETPHHCLQSLDMKHVGASQKVEPVEARCHRITA